MSCCHMFVFRCCAENYLFANLLSFCECTQKLKVIFLSVLVKGRVLYYYELLPFCLYLLCRKLPYLDFFVSLWVPQKFEVMFLSGRKIIELFTSCSHRFFCTRFRYFFVFCEWSQKLKVLSSCVVVKLRVFCTNVVIGLFVLAVPKSAFSRFTCLFVSVVLKN